MLRQVWVLVFLLLASPALAEPPPSSASSDRALTATLDAADHDALRKLMAEATVALNQLDGSGLARFLADGFVLTFSDQTVVKDIAQLDGYIAEYFKGENAPLKSVQFSPEATEKVSLIDDRTGVAYGTSVDAYTLANGTQLVLDTHWTATVVKNDDRWLVQTFHAGVNMLDNPILEAAGESSLFAGGAGLVVGLLLGALLMRVFRRS